MTARKKLPPQILCIPKTESSQELAEIYSVADVYFNAGIEETMGLTTVEVLACNAPVVVCNKTAIPEVVLDSMGIVLELGDIKQVKEAIDELINNKSLLRMDYRKFVQQYKKETSYTNYIELYKTLII